MRSRVVVFDFYGTLSVSATQSERREGAGRIAAVLGIPADVFHEAIATTYTERATGSCGDLEATMRWLADRCGCTPTPDQLREACRLRFETEARYARMLRPEAVPTVKALKEQGVRVGLISDCTHELPEIWASLPLARYIDATVFSVQVGLRKPHPDLYATLTLRLNVEARDCLYVGDGGSGELTGARHAGMTAFHFNSADATDGVRYDPEVDWDGPSISALSEVLDLVGAVPNTGH